MRLRSKDLLESLWILGNLFEQVTHLDTSKADFIRLFVLQHPLPNDFVVLEQRIPFHRRSYQKPNRGAFQLWFMLRLNLPDAFWIAQWPPSRRFDMVDDVQHHSLMIRNWVIPDLINRSISCRYLCAAKGSVRGADRSLVDNAKSLTPKYTEVSELKSTAQVKKKGQYCASGFEVGMSTKK